MTIIVGHFGTGKTELALNIAIGLGNAEIPFTLADLDVVDPYFRSRECKKIIESKGGRLITSSAACMNADVPSMPAEAVSVFEDKSRYAVMDIGGDASGARVLAQYRNKVSAEECRIICVVNANRPMTSTAEAMAAYIRDIENACTMKVTGLINNTHLCNETTWDDVLKGAKVAREASKLTQIPLLGHSVKENLLACRNSDMELEMIFPIRIYMKKPWEQEVFANGWSCDF